MSIILGFGETEKIQRDNFRNQIKEIILNNHKKTILDKNISDFEKTIFSDKEIKNIKKEIKNLSEKLRKQNDEYKKNNYENAPQRYFYCWTTVVADCNDIFVGVTFYHINTKHPMSPDGLAMLVVRENYWFDYIDDIKKELKED